MPLDVKRTPTGMKLTEQLLTVAREYARAEDVPLSKVSWRVLGDTRRLAAIEAGSDVWASRFEAAMAWFSANWPESAIWPAEIVRPPVPVASEPEAVAS